MPAAQGVTVASAVSASTVVGTSLGLLLGAGRAEALVAPARIDDRLGIVQFPAVRGVELPRFVDSAAVKAGRVG